LTSSIGRQFHFLIVSGTNELANAVVLEKGWCGLDEWSRLGLWTTISGGKYQRLLTILNMWHNFK